MEAATTLASRPTDLKPPEGLHEAAAPTGEMRRSRRSARRAAAAPHRRGPYTNYAFVWLARRNAIARGNHHATHDWINAIAVDHRGRWKASKSSHPM